jgi:hypothetical protein
MLRFAARGANNLSDCFAASTEGLRTQIWSQHLKSHTDIRPSYRLSKRHPNLKYLGV